MRQILFSPPDIKDEDREAVAAVLKSGWITTGPKTKEFEGEIAKYCNVQRAVCLNSATAGLELILRVLGIGPGDEVITSAYTYTATASVICHVGATPVLVDVEPASYHLSIEKLSHAITEKTKAVITVDIGGVMCDYDKIFEAVEHKKNRFKVSSSLQETLGRIAVIADAAHSFGASYKGIRSGKAADFTSFSFHAVKNLTTGEGGAVTWHLGEQVDDESIYKQFMLLSLHGQSKDALTKMQMGAWEYDVIMPAYKCNMTDIAAALGLSQLNRYSKILAYREKLVQLYDQYLKDLPLVTLKHRDGEKTSSCHLYLVSLNGKEEKDRNKIIEALAKKGIASNVHYKPLPMHSAYQKMGFHINDFKEAYAMYKKEVTLPLHTMLTEEDIIYIADALKSLI